MNKDERIAKLKENLRKATAIYSVYESTDFQSSLLPYLTELSTVEHIDPTKFETREQYYFALDHANQRAGTYAEFLKFLRAQQGIMAKIAEEIKKPEVSYSL